MLTVTDRAKEVLVLAAKGARRRGQQRARPENVLLALLGEAGGVACAVLHTLGVDPAALARDLAARLQAPPANAAPGGEAPSDEPPPGLLSAAAAEAGDLGHGYVGTEHLLIAMTRTEGELTAQALAARGVTPATAAATTARLLGRQIT